MIRLYLINGQPNAPRAQQKAEMKFNIAWHKACLANMLAGLKAQRATAHRAIAEADRLEREIDFYESQIAEAERRGLEGFDSERLLLKRRATPR